MAAVRSITALLALPVAVSVILAVPVAASAQARFRFDQTPGRLSKDVLPSLVRLALDLDPGRDTFDGRVEIDLRVAKPVDAIEVHAHELTAADAWLGTGRARRSLEIVPDTGAQIWRLVPRDGRRIAAGTHRIAIAYAGKVQRHKLRPRPRSR